MPTTQVRLHGTLDEKTRASLEALQGKGGLPRLVIELRDETGERIFYRPVRLVECTVEQHGLPLLTVHTDATLLVEHATRPNGEPVAPKSALAQALERAPRGKKTRTEIEEERCDVEALHKMGHSPREIATRLGLSEWRVSTIITGKKR